MRRWPGSGLGLCEGRATSWTRRPRRAASESGGSPRHRGGSRSHPRRYRRDAGGADPTYDARVSAPRPRAVRQTTFKRIQPHASTRPSLTDPGCRPRRWTARHVHAFARSERHVPGTSHNPKIAGSNPAPRYVRKAQIRAFQIPGTKQTGPKERSESDLVRRNGTYCNRPKSRSSASGTPALGASQAGLHRDATSRIATPLIGGRAHTRALEADGVDVVAILERGYTPVHGADPFGAGRAL